MQRLLVISIYLLFANFSFAQFGQHKQVGNYSPPMRRMTDIGILAGGSYYIGELNPTQHFNLKYMHIAYGAFYRRYLNKRFAWRLSANKSKLSGSYATKNNLLQDYNTVATFSSTLIEGAWQIEFNFYEYNPGDENSYFTPYVFYGIGGFFFSPKSSGLDLGAQSSSSGVSYSKRTVCMPFGIGIRYKMHHRFSFGLEWGMRKTYTDYIDNIGKPYSQMWQRGYIYNKDWYNITSLYLAFRIGGKPTTCAAWDKKKR